MSDGVYLPDENDVGTESWWTYPDEDRRPVKITGRLLGTGSSGFMKHSGHTGEVARKKKDCCGPRSGGCRECRCRACRWIEFWVFRLEDGYGILRGGMSNVPGERDWFTFYVVRTASEVVEKFVTRHTRHGRAPYLTPVAAQVLAQAREYDENLATAYDSARARV